MTEKANNSKAKKNSRRRPCNHEDQQIKKLYIRKSPDITENTRNIKIAENVCPLTTEINSLKQHNESLKEKKQRADARSETVRKYTAKFT